MYEANYEEAARYIEAPTEQQAEECHARAVEWEQDLNELAGHHLVVVVEQDTTYWRNAKVSIELDGLRKIGDPKVALAVQAAREAFEKALRN